eukprot:1156229-Pelagomonas_calceolata.AAC.7
MACKRHGKTAQHIGLCGVEQTHASLCASCSAVYRSSSVDVRWPWKAARCAQQPFTWQACLHGHACLSRKQARNPLCALTSDKGNAAFKEKGSEAFQGQPYPNAVRH